MAQSLTVEILARYALKMSMSKSLTAATGCFYVLHQLTYFEVCASGDQNAAGTYIEQKLELLWNRSSLKLAKMCETRQKLMISCDVSPGNYV
jgi:hypothetical protein